MKSKVTSVPALDPVTGEELGHHHTFKSMDAKSNHRDLGVSMQGLATVRDKFLKDLGTNSVSPKQVAEMFERGVFEDVKMPESSREFLMSIADRAYLVTTKEDIELGLADKFQEKPNTLAATTYPEKDSEQIMTLAQFEVDMSAPHKAALEHEDELNLVEELEKEGPSLSLTLGRD